MIADVKTKKNVAVSIKLYYSYSYYHVSLQIVDYNGRKELVFDWWTYDEQKHEHIFTSLRRIQNNFSNRKFTIKFGAGNGQVP
jgi:hypothetical protein